AGEAAPPVVEPLHVLAACLLEAPLQLGVDVVEVRPEAHRAERLLEPRLHVHDVQGTAEAVRQVARHDERLLGRAREVSRVQDAHGSSSGAARVLRAPLAGCRRGSTHDTGAWGTDVPWRGITMVVRG